MSTNARPGSGSSNGHHPDPSVLGAAIRAQINSRFTTPPPPPAPLEEPTLPPRSIAPLDDLVVRALHEQAAQLLAAEFRSNTEQSPEDRRAVGEDISAQVVRAYIDARRQTGERITDEYEQRLLDTVLAYLFGLGRLQAATDDPEVENVMVLGHDRVRIEYADGRVETGPPAASNDHELLQMIQRIASVGQRNERALTAAKPTLHMRLPNGNRLAAMHVVTAAPVIVTRRHRTKKVNLDEMVDLVAIDPVLRQFMAAIVRANLNVIIAGPPGSGKTTLMRAMATQIPRTEWFATMESELELGLHETGEFDWVVAVEAREGHGDLGPDGRPAGEVSLARLFPDMLRLSMRRVLVGEVRADEIVPMFDAMNTMRGSMCTLHVRHADGVLLRLAELLMRYGAADSLTGAWLTVVNALDYIIYCDVIDERPLGGQQHRFVSHVIEVIGMGDGAKPTTQAIFGPGPDGRARPKVHPQRTRADLLRTGFDLAWLNQTDGMWTQPLRTITGGGI
ncbi:CpaF/VirB11 family protein [Dactylosporangium maewongense]|uniref:CpaF/VirB11 family protein n=1 Tax=Dactylosporangium maewongense TaxID=634393 RepID=A0ABP4NXZ3_9ACTN